MQNHDPAKVQRERLVRETIQQMSAAAAYMHECGVMHRDIKLQNIGIVNTSGERLRLILLDFGHAIKQSYSRDHLKGTIRYLAPEVLALKTNPALPAYTFSVDVWALGVVALELIVGQRVRDPPDQLDVSSLQLELVDDGSDASLYSLIRRMLKKNEKRRPTMSDLEKEIRGKRPREPDDDSGRERPSGFSRRIVIPLLPHQLE
ncbi:kinase-like protein [Teratosphaeria destructans]|uniref:Kinase-like protein n=1 Tax=Teratosphaeria destructans TaxID=418781 RepID=A0A9W7W4Y8_9PEZI|nr:kinase-like protein [Teratosphaeria destructans]